eukprot:1682867-Prorocentrum_lima.AAC.1
MCIRDRPEEASFGPILAGACPSWHGMQRPSWTPSSTGLGPGQCPGGHAPTVNRRKHRWDRSGK